MKIHNTLALVEINRLIPYARNSRTHSPEQVAQIVASMKEFGFTNPVLIDEQGGIIAGHGRVMAARELGMDKVPCLTLEGLSEAQKRAYVIADNKLAENAGWDIPMLAQEMEELRLANYDTNLTGFDMSELDRMLDEFSGHHDKSADEYLDFLKKFEEKKTTDDCYTPPKVYEAVKDWTVKEYHLEGRRIVRPFWPGSDYQKFNYQAGVVVIDNPPFSILSEIIAFYVAQNIDFMLFAPTLTLFGGVGERATGLIINSSVTYENGAIISTSFITNMDKVNRVRSAPELKAAIKQAVEDAKDTAQLPVYIYPPNVIVAARLNKISAVDWVIPAKECGPKISALASQKPEGKAIFGGGYLVSDRIAAELKAAELKAAELKAAELKAARDTYEWTLSPDEQAVIQRLNEAEKT